MKHRKQKSALRPEIRKIYSYVGDGFGSEGTLHRLKPSQQTKEQIKTWELARDEKETQLLKMLKSEVQRWYDDRGFHEFAMGESCCRTFFAEVKSKRTHSYIEHTRNTRDQKTRGTNNILREIRKYFGGPGQIFNLNKTEPEEAHQEGETETQQDNEQNNGTGQGKQPDQSGPESPTNSERKRIRNARNQLLKAIRDDGKIHSTSVSWNMLLVGVPAYIPLRGGPGGMVPAYIPSRDQNILS